MMATRCTSGWCATASTRDRLDARTGEASCPTSLGVNYYPGFSTVRFDEDGTAVPVEAGTAGLEDLVRTYEARYGLTMMVTETSRGGPIDERREWLAQSLAAVERMRADGVDLVGYTWFPFVSLFDWSYREADHATRRVAGADGHGRPAPHARRRRLRTTTDPAGRRLSPRHCPRHAVADPAQLWVRKHDARRRVPDTERG